jgi:hypothetical protein
MNHIEKEFMRVFGEYIEGTLTNTKVAIIGEYSRNKTKHSMYGHLKKNHGLKSKNVEIFTYNNRFKVEDGERFDLLIGCRPCRAEDTIFKAATKFGNKFFVMPCLCSNHNNEKTIKYLRTYGVINRMLTTKEIVNSSHIWLILVK